MGVLIVGGRANNTLKTLISKSMEVVGTYESINRLTGEIIEYGVSFLENVESILLLDYAFVGDNSMDRAKDFLELQEVLHINGLTEDDAKLYFVTKDSDLYDIIRDERDGMPGIHYINAKVILVKGDYKQQVLFDTLRGKLDNRGLYHPDVGKNTLYNKLSEGKNQIIEDTRAVKSELLNYGKDTPYTNFHPEDYADSTYTQNQLKQEEREQEKSRRKQERERRAGKATPERTIAPPPEPLPAPEPPPAPLIPDYTPPEPPKAPPLRSSGPVVDVADVLRIKKEIDNMRRFGYVYSDKVKQDTGVITVIGDSQIGKSGIVANLADTYALVGRRVLVVDLDITGRQQSVYYQDYEQRAKSVGGMDDGLIKACLGGGVVKTSVDITSRISVLGVGRTVTLDIPRTKQTIVENIQAVVDEARGSYDIVLIDTQYREEADIISELIGVSDNFILVTGEKDYRNEVYYKNILHEDYKGININDMLMKTKIIVNKIHRDVELYTGQPFNESIYRNWLRENLKPPYSGLHVIGEIPHYSQWEMQYSVNSRYVFLEEMALRTYSDILNNLLL